MVTRMGILTARLGTPRGSGREVARRVARPPAQFIPPKITGEGDGVAKRSDRAEVLDEEDRDFMRKISSLKKITIRLGSALGLVVAIASFYGAVISGFEGWKFEKALFLAFTVLSTIGYGNYAPDSEGARVFTGDIYASRAW